MKKTLLMALTAACAVMGATTSQAATPCIMTDLGTDISYSPILPTVGANDQYNTNAAAIGGSMPPGLNYYNNGNSGNPVGQIWVTGNNASGYTLRSVDILTFGDNGNYAPQFWDLYIYQYNTGTSNATLIGTFQSQNNFAWTDAHWLQFDQFAQPVGLSPNTHYAYTVMRGVQGWERLASDSGDQYAPDANCQAMAVPVAGGTPTFSSAAGWDATFAIGLNTISNNIIVNPPSITPDVHIFTNSVATLTVGTIYGAPSPTYQWQSDSGTGGALANIGGATTSTYSPPTTAVGVYRYDIVVGNGSGSYATSSVVTVYVTIATASVTLTDTGSGGPVSGPYDISQFQSGNWSATAGQGDGDGLNYYDNNPFGPGQTFTTGAATLGYDLTALAVRTAANHDNGIGNPHQYWLHFYKVTGGNNAVLIQDYTNNPLIGVTASGDWLQWSGLGLHLDPNSLYAYSFQNRGGETGAQDAYGYLGLDSTTNADVAPYAGGQMCLIAPLGGTIVFGTNMNGIVQSGVFDIGVAPMGVIYTNVYVNPILQSTTLPVLSNSVVTLSEDALGQAPLSYTWQTDNGGATWSTVPGSASNLTVTVNWAAGIHHYRVIVSNLVPSSGTSAPVAVSAYSVNGNVVLADLGAGIIPTPGLNDISQTNAGAVKSFPGGLNYYIDNGTPPGETFTTLASGAGYTLNSLAIQMSGDSGGGLTNGNAGQNFFLRIYQFDPVATNASLYAIYTSQIFSNLVTAVSDTDWFQLTGMSLHLAPSTMYAYTFGRDVTSGTGFGYCNLGNVGGFYAGGQACLIPIGGGLATLGTDGTQTGVFDIGLSVASFPVTLSAARSGANLQVTYGGGILLQASALTGPWTTNATTPVTATATVSIPTSGSKLFFKVLKNP